VDLVLMHGERRSVIGPNGAGKTTLFNVVSGELGATSGKVFLNGKDVTGQPSYRRVEHGFARTFQINNLFPTMTVLENVVIALLGHQSARFVCWKPMSSYKTLHHRANEIIEQFGLSHLKNELVSSLSYGDCRVLEVVLGLSSNPSLLALDEPSSGLSSAEAGRLVEVLQSLDPSLALLVIEHDMRVAFELTQTMTVMCEGRVVADGLVEDVRNNPRVREIYLGTCVSDEKSQRGATP
jgi:branched-chain amino acid transport system ATP-binding protein